MLYLKTYESFDSDMAKWEQHNPEVLKTLMDISLDITDDGYQVRVNNSYPIHKPEEIPVVILKPDSTSSWASLTPSKSWSHFNLHDISDCLKQMFDYMKSEGYGCIMFAAVVDGEGFKLEHLGWAQLDKSHQSSGVYKNRMIKFVDIKFIKKISKNESSEIFTTGNQYDAQVSPIIDTLSDICQELKDDNWDDPLSQFSTEIKAVGPLKNKEDKLGIYIRISRREGFVVTKSFEETLNRIDSFLTSEGYKKKGYHKFDGYHYEILYR